MSRKAAESAGAPARSKAERNTGAAARSADSKHAAAPETSQAAETAGESTAPKSPAASQVSEAPETSADAGHSATAGHPDDITVRDPVSAPDAKGRPRRVTRRFPLFTRDTARPEGGGRAAAGDAPAPARQWPVLAVVLLVGLGLLLTALDVFRWGTLLIGAALLAGAALRWVVPDVGMLAVRSRFTDITTYGVLGLSIVLLSLMAQPKPVLEIPFLKDTLHFTVS
ncbi:DUF3017 domain-containing protein [Streptomyces coelicoflavus]